MDEILIISIEDLKELCIKAKHILYIIDHKYVLKNMANANKLTYEFNHQVIDFCNKTIESWKKE